MLRSVILLVPFCIERDYDDERATSLLHVEVLEIKFLVYLVRGSWSCCLYLVTRSVSRRPQVLTFHLSTQLQQASYIKSIRDCRALVTYKTFKPALPQPQRSELYASPEDLLSTSDSTDCSYRLRLCQHIGCQLNAPFHWMLQKLPNPSKWRDRYVVLCDMLHRCPLRVARLSFILIYRQSLHVRNPSTMLAVKDICHMKRWEILQTNQAS